MALCERRWAHKTGVQARHFSVGFFVAEMKQREFLFSLSLSVCLPPSLSLPLPLSSSKSYVGITSLKQKDFDVNIRIFANKPVADKDLARNVSFE